MAGRPKRKARALGLEPPASVGSGGRKFEHGHELGLTHGAYRASERLLADERTREIRAEIAASAPVQTPADELVLDLLAVTTRRIEMAAAALARADELVGDNPLGGYTFGDAAKLERVREDMRRWIALAVRLAETLGMTPASRAKLGLHVASARRQATLADLHALASEEEALDVEAQEEPLDAA